MRRATGVILAVAALGVSSRPGRGGASVEIHYAPHEDLERIDVDVIDNAERSIDMAAYVLSDRAVIEALTRRRRSRRDDPALSRQEPVFAARPARRRPDRGTAGFPQRVRARQGARRADAPEGLCGRRRAAAHRLRQFLALRAWRPRTTTSSWSTIPPTVARFERNFEAIWSRGTNAAALPSLERGGAR